MTQAFILCVLGALLELDTTYAFQLTFSRGIIAGPLLSLVTGDLATGLQVGIFTELLFIDISPLGGMLPPSNAICCALTLALCTLNIPVYIAFFFGVLGALLFSGSEIFMRKRRGTWVLNQEEKIVNRPTCITRIVVTALGLCFLFNLLFNTVFVMLVGTLVAKIMPHLSEKAHIAAKFAFMAVPWIGLATLITTFRLKTR